MAATAFPKAASPEWSDEESAHRLKIVLNERFGMEVDDKGIVTTNPVQGETRLTAHRIGYTLRSEAMGHDMADGHSDVDGGYLVHRYMTEAILKEEDVLERDMPLPASIAQKIIEIHDKGVDCLGEDDTGVEDAKQDMVTLLQSEFVDVPAAKARALAERLAESGIIGRSERIGRPGGTSQEKKSATAYPVGTTIFISGYRDGAYKKKLFGGRKLEEGVLPANRTYTVVEVKGNTLVVESLRRRREIPISELKSGKYHLKIKQPPPAPSAPPSASQQPAPTSKPASKPTGTARQAQTTRPSAKPAAKPQVKPEQAEEAEGEYPVGTTIKINKHRPAAFVTTGTFRKKQELRPGVLPASAQGFVVESSKGDMLTLKSYAGKRTISVADLKKYHIFKAETPKEREVRRYEETAPTERVSSTLDKITVNRPVFFKPGQYFILQSSPVEYFKQHEGVFFAISDLEMNGGKPHYVIENKTQNIGPLRVPAGLFNRLVKQKVDRHRKPIEEEGEPVGDPSLDFLNSPSPSQRYAVAAQVAGDGPVALPEELRGALEKAMTSAKITVYSAVNNEAVGKSPPRDYIGYTTFCREGVQNDEAVFDRTLSRWVNNTSTNPEQCKELMTMNKQSGRLNYAFQGAGYRVAGRRDSGGRPGSIIKVTLKLDEPLLSDVYKHLSANPTCIRSFFLAVSMGVASADYLWKHNIPDYSQADGTRRLGYAEDIGPGSRLTMKESKNGGPLQDLANDDW